MHAKDLLLLKQIQSFFGVGTIKVRKSNNQVIFSVSSAKDIITRIIPHFEKYTLLTQKRADFELFKSIIELMNKAEHLTTEGLVKIVRFRASMNNGLTKVLEESFSGISPVPRPAVSELDQKIKDPN